MGKTQEPERAPEQSQNSVDLHNRGVPLEQYIHDHGEIATSDGEGCVTVNAGSDEAQEMLAALAALAERSPRAVVVLLLSAVRRKSNSETASIMHIQQRKVEYAKAWLRKHCPGMAACCQGS